jgi:hypothetical protein
LLHLQDALPVLATCEVLTHLLRHLLLLLLLLLSAQVVLLTLLG